MPLSLLHPCQYNVPQFSIRAVMVVGQISNCWGKLCFSFCDSVSFANESTLCVFLTCR